MRRTRRCSDSWPRSRLYPASVQPLQASKPVDVWIVERLAQKTAYAADPNYDHQRLNAPLARFHPVVFWSDSHLRLYRASV
jgi:hypothetical protein